MSDKAHIQKLAMNGFDLLRSLSMIRTGAGEIWKKHQKNSQPKRKKVSDFSIKISYPNLKYQI